LNNLKYQVALHLIIFIWGFTAILGKLIATDAFVLVWYRVIIAFVSLLLFLLLLRREIRINEPKKLWSLFGVGILVAMHWLFFYLSIKVSTASLAIICLSTTTIHVAWLEPLVMRRKAMRSEFILGLIIVVGILLITGKVKGEGVALGVVFGLISALLAALFATFNAKLIQSTSASKITLYEMLSASVIMTIVLAVMGDLNSASLSISSNDFLLLLFLGIICTSIAFLATVEITKYLGAFTVTLSINMEPIYTLGLAIWMLQEHQELNMYFYIGAMIIVSAVFGNAILKKQSARRLRKIR
jgi:drug/metabolite transporter (DMT)-like permease